MELKPYEEDEELTKLLHKAQEECRKYLKEKYENTSTMRAFRASKRWSELLNNKQTSLRVLRLIETIEDRGLPLEEIIDEESE